MWDCGCVEVKTGGIPTTAPKSPYITRKFFCVDTASGEDAAFCQVTVHASSCELAKESLQNQSSKVDPCNSCSGITDNTRRYKGIFEDVQGGTCR
jgi:hypothetical protein